MATQPAQLQRRALGLRDVVFQGITHIAPAINVVFTLPVIAAQAGATMPLSLLLSVIVCFFIANTVPSSPAMSPPAGILYLCLTRPGTAFRVPDHLELLDLRHHRPRRRGRVSGLCRLRLFAEWDGRCHSVVDLLHCDCPHCVGINLLRRQVFNAHNRHSWWYRNAHYVCARYNLPPSSRIRVFRSSAAQSRCCTDRINGCPGRHGLFDFGAQWLRGSGSSGSRDKTTRQVHLPGHLHLTTDRGHILYLHGLCQRCRLGNRQYGSLRRQCQSLLYARTKALGSRLVARVLRDYQQYVGGRHRLYQRRQPRDVYHGRGWRSSSCIENHPSSTQNTVGSDPCGANLPDCELPGRRHILRGKPIFGFLGTITTLAVIVLYVLANFALTTFIRHEHPTDFSLWRHGLIPTIGTLLLLPVLFVTVWPIPTYPLDLPPYVFIVLMIIGFVAMQVVAMRRPSALARGSAMQISTVESTEGEETGLEEPQIG